MNDEFNKVIIDDILESFGEHGSILVALGVHNLTNDNFIKLLDFLTDIYARGMVNGWDSGLNSMMSLTEPGGLADPGERGANWDRAFAINRGLKAWFGTPDAWLARKFDRSVKKFNKKLNELRDLEHNKSEGG